MANLFSIDLEDKNSAASSAQSAKDFDEFLKKFEAAKASDDANDDGFLTLSDKFAKIDKEAPKTGLAKYFPSAEQFTPMGESGDKTYDAGKSLGVGAVTGVLNSIKNANDVVTPSEVTPDSLSFKVNSVLFGDKAAKDKAASENALASEHQQIDQELNTVKAGLPQPETALGDLTHGIGQYAPAAIPIEGSLRAVTGAGSVLSRLLTTVSSAGISGQIAGDPDDPTLFDTLNSVKALPDFADWLAKGQGDDEADKRFKMLIQDLGLGVAFGAGEEAVRGVIQGAKAFNGRGFNPDGSIEGTFTSTVHEPKFGDLTVYDRAVKYKNTVFDNQYNATNKSQVLQLNGPKPDIIPNDTDLVNSEVTITVDDTIYQDNGPDEVIWPGTKGYTGPDKTPETNAKEVLPGYGKRGTSINKANDNIEDFSQDTADGMTFDQQSARDVTSKLDRSPRPKMDYAMSNYRGGTKAVNDNVPGGMPKADNPQGSPSPYAKGWYIGRNEDDNFIVLTEDGHYITYPDAPGTSLDRTVEGLATKVNKEDMVAYWMNRFQGKESPESYTSIVEFPAPVFTRDKETGNYVSADGKHTITRGRGNRGWALYSDPAGANVGESSEIRVSVGDPNQELNPARPGTRQNFRKLQDAIDAAGMVDKEALMRPVDTPWEDFKKKVERNYTPEEQANQAAANELFVTTQGALDARHLDRINKAGGKAAALGAWTKDTLNKFRREVLDAGVFLDDLGQKAFGFTFSSPNDLVRIHKMQNGIEPIDWEHPFFSSGAYESVADIGNNPYSTWSRTASTSYRINAFIEKGGVHHPTENPITSPTDFGGGSPHYTFDTSVKPYAGIYQPLLEAGDFEEFQAYFGATVAKFRAEERGKGSLIDNYDEIIQRVAQSADPEKMARYNKAIDDLQDVFHSVIKYARDAGVYSDDDYARIIAKNTPKDSSRTLYNPFYYDSVVDKGDWFERSAVKSSSKMKTIQGITAEEARAKGLRLLNPYQAGLKYISSMVRAADLNWSKLTTIRYVEDAMRRNAEGTLKNPNSGKLNPKTGQIETDKIDFGIEFAPSKTSVSAPNWSIADAYEKNLNKVVAKNRPEPGEEGEDQLNLFDQDIADQMDELLGEGAPKSGKQYLMEMYESIGKDLNLTTKEISGLMDNGYSTLIGFGKGRVMKDANGEPVLMDVVFDNGKPRVFKVTDRNAIAFFSNGGRLPDDPFQMLADNDIIKTMGNWIVNGSRHPYKKYANWLAPGPVSRLAGSLITNNPAFPAYAFWRDAKGNAVGSVVMQQGKLGKAFPKTEAVARAVAEFQQTLADSQFYDLILLNGGSYTSRSDTLGIHSSKGSFRLLNDALKDKKYLKGPKGEKGSLEQYANYFARRMTGGAAKTWDAYMRMVEISEMAPRIAEARLAQELGMSVSSSTFLARMTSGGDLARKGSNSFVRGYFATVPFMNASGQGLYRTYTRAGEGFKGLREALIEATRKDTSIRINPDGSIEGDYSILDTSNKTAITDQSKSAGQELTTQEPILGEEVLPEGRAKRTAKALTKSGAAKFIIGMTSMVLPAAYTTYILNAYYPEDYATLTPQQKANYSYLPRYNNPEDSIAAHVAIFKRMTGLDPEAKIPKADGLMAIGPKPYDWGSIMNLAQDTVDVMFNSSYGSAGLAERFISSLSNIMPGNFLPFMADTYERTMRRKEDPYGKDLPQAGDDLLPEDVTQNNTSIIALDTARVLNKAWRGATGSDSSGLLTAVEADMLMKGYMPGFASYLFDIADATDRTIRNNVESLIDKEKVLDERTFKLIENINAHLPEGTDISAWHNPVTAIGFDVFSKPYLTGNEKINELYAFKKSASRLAGSFNLRRKAVEDGLGGGVPEYEEFVKTMQDEHGEATWIQYLIGLNEPLGEAVKSVEEYQNYVRYATNVASPRHWDDQQVDDAYRVFQASATEKLPDRPTPEYKRAYIASQYRKARDLYLNQLSRIIGDIPSNDDEFIDMVERNRRD